MLVVIRTKLIFWRFLVSIQVVVTIFKKRN